MAVAASLAFSILAQSKKKKYSLPRCVDVASLREREKFGFFISMHRCMMIVHEINYSHNEEGQPKLCHEAMQDNVANRTTCHQIASALLGGLGLWLLLFRIPLLLSPSLLLLET